MEAKTCRRNARKKNGVGAQKGRSSIGQRYQLKTRRKKEDDNNTELEKTYRTKVRASDVEKERKKREKER